MASRRGLHGEVYAAGFAVTDSEHAEEGLALCRIMRFDMVLLSFAMHEKSGKTCNAFRSVLPRTPILVLSECDDPNRKVHALEAGADDYLVKPYHLQELIARIRCALRRSCMSSNHSAEVITIGDITLDVERRLVFRAGEPVHLTPKEFSLLHYLMTNAGLPMRHSSLLSAVWGPEHADQVEYLRTFMRQLRTKLDDSANPRYLLTDSHVGYHFADTPKAKTTPEGNADPPLFAVSPDL
jgi:two-component system KDP operon response regulator KdpE